ncbi:MAG: biotin--[acetyl-CoA-carboxylase] ligase [Actinomycetota bacterium]|nr:biotin--[acetyl-CoA-carboxylase] ligase [Actinomycetota bacterium]
MPSLYGDLDRPPLHAEALRRSLVAGGAIWTEITVADASPSTNAELAQRARSTDDDGVVLIAEHQTAGRGRLDRSWTAPPRSGLTLSVLLRPYDVAVSRWSWIPLLAGVVVAATVRQAANVEAGVKWPNDVVVGDRKLGGILVERTEVTGRPPAAVIGIGLNVSQREEELPVPTATSLVLEEATTTDRGVLARTLLRNLERVYESWRRAGGDPEQGLRAAYASACVSLDRQVRVHTAGGGSVTGLAVGIDDHGRLLVRGPDGRQAFGSGDVVHLRPLT